VQEKNRECETREKSDRPAIPPNGQQGNTAIMTNRRAVKRSAIEMAKDDKTKTAFTTREGTPQKHAARQGVPLKKEGSTEDRHQGRLERKKEEVNAESRICANGPDLLDR